MRVRWPFDVALVATVVGTGALAATPHIKSAWDERQYAQLEKAAAAEFAKEQPAADALERMARPPGVKDCFGASGASIARTHMFCWEGPVDIERTTAALATGLRGIGAEDVSPACVRRPDRSHAALRIRCGVTARILGQSVSIGVRPSVEKVGESYRTIGAWIDGMVWPGDEGLDLLSPTATPLPVS